MNIRPLTTFGVGGTAIHYLKVHRPDELIAAVFKARSSRLPYFILAGGSNIVGPDGPWRGFLIHYFRSRGGIELTGRTLTVEAGVSLARLIRFAVRRGLGGLENLSGIPGTVGGAVVGNAGAYGKAIPDYLKTVEIFDGENRRWLSKENCRFTYRESVFKEKPWLVLRARFYLRPAAAKELIKTATEIIKKRLKKYPLGLRCPGSFFKNILAVDLPEKTRRLIPSEKILEGKIPAGYLLEAVGACGMKTTHLYVALYHGNLIINRGGATVQEVKDLAADLKRKVLQKFNIALKEEVRYIL